MITSPVIQFGWDRDGCVTRFARMNSARNDTFRERRCTQSASARTRLMTYSFVPGDDCCTPVGLTEYNSTVLS